MNTPVRQALRQQGLGLVAAMEHSGCSNLAQALLDKGAGREPVGLDAGIQELLEPSSLRVVFLYTPPEIAVANALLEGLDPIGFLEEWVSQHQLLLGYLKRHRGRWVLLEAASASLNLSGAASAVGAPLPEPDAQLAAPAPMALERMLAAGVLQGAADAQRIAAHLAALATPVEAAQTAPPALEDAIREYLDSQSERRDQSEFMQRLETKALGSQKEVERFREQISGLEARLAEVDAELESGRLAAEALAAERQAEMDELNQAKADAEVLASTQMHELSESRKENELVLLQLHQVQEELESWFVKARSSEEELATVRQAAADAEARAQTNKSELEHANHARASAETSVSDHAAEIADMRKESELLLLQLHQVQEELESWFMKARGSEEELATVRQAAADAEAKAETYKSELDHANHARASAETSVSDHAAEIADMRKESELLLLQLHQVQEELESWFLKARRAEEDLKISRSAREKLQKVLTDTKASLNQARGNKEIAEKLARERLGVIQQLRKEKRQLEKPLADSKQLRDPPQKAAVVPAVAESIEPLDSPKKDESRHTVDSAKIPVLHAETSADSVKPASASPGSGFGGLFRRKRRIKRLKKKDVVLIRKSELFDGEWYLRINSDVADAGFDPAEHYLAFGFAERRNPSRGFDGAFYLEQNQDVSLAGNNPLLHYLKHGKAEGRVIRAAEAG
jgi:hypothetical protein